MQVLDAPLVQDLEAKETTRIDLGSGGNRRRGFHGIDHLSLAGSRAVADLNKPPNLGPDQLIDHMRTRHVLEHIDGSVPLSREIHRICRAGALIEISGPDSSNAYALSDSMHVRSFGLLSMSHHVLPDKRHGMRRVPAFCTGIRSAIQRVRIEFHRQRRIGRQLAGAIVCWINMSPQNQESREGLLAHWFHSWQITYRMRAVHS